MSTPLIPEEVILALHQELIRKFGGASGVRNHATLRGEASIRGWKQKGCYSSNNYYF